MRHFVLIMHDMADAQLPEGLVPSIAPEYAVFEGGVRDSPEWGSAIIQVPWQHYLWTGDIRPLRQYYPAMQRYFGWLARRAENGLLLYGLGDWYDRGPRAPGQSQLTPAGLTATATFHEDAMTLARIALLLGREQDAEVFAAAAFDIREAFNARFFDVQRGTYAGGSQTANAMPLALHMVEDQYADDVLAALLADIRNHRGALTAGDVGHRYVLRALADAGLSDVIHAMHHRTDIPGYGYQIEHGATSLAEAWDAEPRSSQNHFMLGQIVEWFYHDLADIRPDAGQPGFKHTIIHPEIITGLDSAGADYRTLHGTISVRWSRMGDRLRLHVTIPHNTTATVHVPSRGRRVTEGGRPAHRAQGVQFLQTNGDRMIFSIGSGDYHFESVLPVR